MPIVQTKQLSKKYKQFYAVQNINLTINEGEIYGLIGLNGAGKTTLFRLLLGLIQPSMGTCFLFNQQVNRKNNHLWRHVGFIVENPSLYPELTVYENLHLYFNMQQLTNKQAINDVIKLLQLTRYQHIKTRELSLGNKQRLGIARALLHKPKLLILDEPVNGLDPAGIKDIRQLLQHLAYNENITIIVSSHLLSEIVKTTTTIGIIHHGRLIKEIKQEQLPELLKRTLLIHTNNNEKAFSLLKQRGYPFEQTKRGELKSSAPSLINLRGKIATLLVENNYSLKKLYVETENMENYFLRILQEKQEEN